MVSLWSFVFLLGNLFVFGHAACPRIISRAEWGARPPAGASSYMAEPVPYSVVHNGGSNAYCYDQAACMAIVRAYQDYHMDTNGFDDIGFNFVVGEDGNVYEGRGWGVVGAQAPNFNTRSIGICIIGDFASFLPNQAALNAVQQLIECGVLQGRIAWNYMLIGHRQVAATDCPGDALFSEIQKWPHWTPSP